MLLTDEVKLRTPEELLLLFVTPFGIVPWELEHVYPAQQTIFPLIFDSDTLSLIHKRVTEVLQTISCDEMIWMDRNTPLDSISEGLTQILHMEKTTEIVSKLSSPTTENQSWAKRKLKAILAHQWLLKEELDELLEDTDISFSKSTGKIRHIMKNGEIVFTMVPTTGLLTPTYEGGVLLLNNGIDMRFLVTMDDDASEFVAKGKSALSKFVVNSSPLLRPGEEVIIIDGKQHVLGVGKTVLNGIEMQAFNRGVAVSVRHARDK